MGISLARLSSFKEYYVWLKKTRKESTCRSHVEHITRLLRVLDSPYPTYISSLDLINSLQLEGKRARYINHIIDSLKVYTTFLKETGKEYDEGIYNLKYLKLESVDKATLSDKEIEAFLSLEAPKMGFYHFRTGKWVETQNSKIGYSVWTLFFSILAYSGMRPTEVAHLRVEDIDFGRNVFVLNDTKTNDSRLVPIAKSLIEKLQKRIEEVDDYLFPSSRGGNNNAFGKVFDSVDWGYNFKTRIKRLGIKRRNLTVYSLRHSFITRLLGEDINIFKVQKIVGHKRIETTNQYTHLTTKDIQMAILKDPLYIQSSPEGKLNYIKEVVKSLLLDKVEGLMLTISETPASFKLDVELEKYDIPDNTITDNNIMLSK